MFFPEGQVRVFLYGEPVSMRRSFDGLYALARHSMRQDPLSGHLFAFINRRATQIKVLYFDRSGLCVWTKRLEQGRLIGDWGSVTTREMDWTGLKLLLEGIEPKQVRKRYRKISVSHRIAALVPPPRTHRHRYYGVLAPNAPWRAAVTALAPVPVAAQPPADPAGAQQASAHRAAARYRWALLLARIYGVFPLTCPFCFAAMRIIAFITEPSTVRQILEHLGEPTRPPRIAPARGPPLWEAATAAAASNDPAWDHAAPPAPDVESAPDVEFDQRITW